MWHPRRFIYVQSVLDEFWESLNPHGEQPEIKLIYVQSVLDEFWESLDFRKGQPKIKPAVDISQELHQLAENSFSRDRSQARCLQIVISSVARKAYDIYRIRPKEVDKLDSWLSHLERARQ